MADAINRAKSTNPEDIRKALVATNIPPDQLVMPWTGVRFDEKGPALPGRDPGNEAQVVVGPSPRDALGGPPADVAMVDGTATPDSWMRITTSAFSASRSATYSCCAAQWSTRMAATVSGSLLAHSADSIGR